MIVPKKQKTAWGWGAVFLLGIAAILNWSSDHQSDNEPALSQQHHAVESTNSAQSATLPLPSNTPESIQQVTYNEPISPTSPPPTTVSLQPGLTDDDLKILQDLPPICTSELPGLDLRDQPAQVKLATMNGAHDRTTNVIASTSHVTSTPSKYAPNPNPNPNLNLNLNPNLKPNPTSNPQPRIAANLNPHTRASAEPKKTKPIATLNTPDPHLEIYSRDAFPSAKECATCHKQIYEEWAVSSHAYASVSPMFHSFEDTINRLSQGTIGYFCMRCHAPVATTMGLRRDQAIWDGPRVFREGVTCVACHRVKIPYTKSNGERRMEPGDVFSPVYGAGEGIGADIANKYDQFFKVKTDRTDTAPGQPIHERAIQFEELSESTFCASCHQVAIKPGIKLEVVWDQYRASPAYREGVTCQDCHTGKVPGVDAGYSIGPAAVVDNKVVNSGKGAERKHTNHNFYGPGYSIAHPGIFPDNVDADRWKFNEWLEFDWRAGWGTEEFENALADRNFSTTFPRTWQNADDRFDAREIITANQKKLAYKKDLRRQLLENGSKLDGPFFSGTPARDETLNFRYCLTNINPGHNMPSGSLGAQPQVWMNVVLIGPAGHRVWESGYMDSNGDLADQHSLDVLARRIPLDNQLMNLQTKFMTSNVKGTDREMYLPLNFDFDQLPFLRPAQQPVSVINHPPNIRMEAHSIPPLGSRNVKYSVPARLIKQPGVYRLSVRLRSRAEPIYFMRFCNATPEMERSMNEGIVDFHTSTVSFEVR